ncbi:MAG TPA: Na+/H+ antiporter NhaA [Actinomycetes bacterium]|nr:Na+/H+ antiporter NhaA [Actinomycetes bacterium]
MPPGEDQPLGRAPLRVPRPLREFLREETAGGAVLVVAVTVALAWANSPWRAAAEALWHTRLAVRLGDATLDDDLRGWVNEGLMAVFFLVVGLELKRELVAGELGGWRQAALPVVAAAGGMAVPAAVYALLNAGGPGARGWGVPMATDVAFALGALALLGTRVPAALKVLLLALAVVDDLGSIVVVAVFYRQDVRLPALAAAAGLLLAAAGLRRARIAWAPAVAAVALGLWLALRQGGVSPALAGAAVGLLAPARPVSRPGRVRERSDALAGTPGPGPVRDVVREARGTVSVAERLAHALHPLSAFLVVPLFALANAGVGVEAGALGRPGSTGVLAGILAGRVLGKPAGILLAAWLAVRCGLGRLPAGVAWRHLAGMATVAGIGFTVPLFVADLAFPAGEFAAAVKLGLLAASLLAGLGGLLVLRTARPAGGRAPAGPPRRG